MIALGERIVGKKTGLLVPSTVVGVLEAPLYRRLTPFVNFTKWDEIYPDWVEKQVVCGQFDQPTLNLTYKEFMDAEHRLTEELRNTGGKNTFEEEENKDSVLESELVICDVYDELRKSNKHLYERLMRATYELKARKVLYVWYPIDDVEVM